MEGQILYSLNWRLVWQSGLSCRVPPTSWLCCAVNALLWWYYMNLQPVVGQQWNRLIILFFLWLFTKREWIVSDQGDPLVYSCPVAGDCSIAHTVRARIPSSTTKFPVKLWVTLSHIQTSASEMVTSSKKGTSLSPPIICSTRPHTDQKLSLFWSTNRIAYPGFSLRLFRIFEVPWEMPLRLRDKVFL